MKKSIFVTAVLLLALTSQAFAYFDNGDLVQVVYGKYTVTDDSGLSTTHYNMERTVDLGAVSGMSGVVNAGTWSDSLLSTFKTGTDAATQSTISDLSMGYFAYNVTSTYDWWFATANSTAPTVGTTTAGFDGAYDLFTSTYRNTSSSLMTGDANNTGSYQYAFDQNGKAPGTYGGFNRAAINPGETALDALANAGGFVDMYLFHYTTNDDGDLVLVKGAATDYQAILRYSANASSVPIPASLLLFGSGLLGLVGLKRKNAAVSA